jgi:hypothetical protein
MQWHNTSDVTMHVKTIEQHASKRGRLKRGILSTFGLPQPQQSKIQHPNLLVP